MNISLGLGEEEGEETPAPVPVIKVFGATVAPIGQAAGSVPLRMTASAALGGRLTAQGTITVRRGSTTIATETLTAKRIC